MFKKVKVKKMFYDDRDKQTLVSFKFIQRFPCKQVELKVLVNLMKSIKKNVMR